MIGKSTGDSYISPPPAKHERTATRVVHNGEKFRLRTDTLSLPGGPELEKDIVDHPGSVVIIPITDCGEIVLIEQWRPAIGKYSVELPSGTRELDESEENTAHRELREESGFRSTSLWRIGQLYPLTGYSTELCAVYVAHGLVRDPLPQDKLEDIQTVTESVDAVWRLITNNEIDDALTVAAMALGGVRCAELVPEVWAGSM